MSPPYMTKWQAKVLLPGSACRTCVRIVRRCADIETYVRDRERPTTCPRCGAEFDMSELILRGWEKGWLIENSKRRPSDTLSLKELIVPLDKVFQPGPNRIFVFGSNLAGVHGAGAAKTALEQYGAVWGQGEGLQGQSYALPTKDEKMRTLPLEVVGRKVDRFIRVAEEHPELYFFVTRVGCGLAGFTDDQIVPLFKYAPENCELPYGWR